MTMKRVTISFDSADPTISSVIESLNLTDHAATSLSITISDTTAVPLRGKPGRKPGPQPPRKLGSNVHPLAQDGA